MYTKIGEEKDDKVVKLWGKDADGILIFVSTRVIPLRPLTQKTVDWFILYGCCYLPCGVHPGPETTPAIYFRFLSREDL